MTSEKVVQEKALPSPHFTWDKQIEILKACAIYYGKNNAGASYRDIANILDYDKTNVSGSLKFWRDTGLIASDKGVNVPSQLLTEFNQKIQWGEDEEAWRIFRSAIESSWFVEQVKMKFQLKSQLTREEITRLIGVSSGSVSGDRGTQKSISILIDLLENSKTIIKGEDGNYSLGLQSEKNGGKLVVDESKDMLQVRIENETYAIDTKEVREFVLTNGKKISTSVQEIK